MNIHVLQHAPFEDIGSIREWIDSRGYGLAYTRLFAGDALPAFSSFDGLIIMGGPMSVNEPDRYEWMAGELSFIRMAIKEGKKALGICLGAQAIARALGAVVRRNAYKEIGWFPVRFEEAGNATFPSLQKGEELTVFHWHGETFDLPEGAAPLFSSKACKNQGFAVGENTLALQFHIEMSDESLASLFSNCRDELSQGDYIQTESEILGGFGTFGMSNKKLLFEMLDSFFCE